MANEKRFKKRARGVETKVSLDELLVAVEIELVAYFSERARAGDEGLLEWELDSLIGRIAQTARQSPHSGDTD